jgi:hypothetical protein
MTFMGATLLRVERLIDDIEQAYDRGIQAPHTGRHRGPGRRLLPRKVFAGVVGVFVPLVALIGALRLAKPGSRWARHYEGMKRERAVKRFAEAA